MIILLRLIRSTTALEEEKDSNITSLWVKARPPPFMKNCYHSGDSAYKTKN